MDNVFIYYDFPIVFSARNEQDDIFLCLFADETESALRYICTEIPPSARLGLQSNAVDVRSIFEHPAGRIFNLSLNAQSQEPMAAVETEEDITPFLPDPGLFIGDMVSINVPAGLTSLAGQSVNTC
jgi:hypothetical protein